MPPSSQSKSDAELMLAVAGGEIECAAALFERHHEKLYRFFFSRLRSAADSMDAVQDVFDRMIRYRHSFRGGTFLPWLFRIARNIANDRYRSSASVVTPLHEVDRVDSSPLADHRLEVDENHRDLRSALDMLSGSHREVLILSRYADLSYAEISKVLDCTTSAVKVRVHRALLALRKNYLELSEEIK